MKTVLFHSTLKKKTNETVVNRSLLSMTKYFFSFAKHDSKPDGLAEQKRERRFQSALS